MLPDEGPEDRKRDGSNPFDELGLSQEQFAEIALSSPLDWDSEQLDYLQMLLEGDPLEPEVTRALVEDFISHTPKTPPIPQKPISSMPRIPRELMDPEELAEEMAGTPITSYDPITYQPVPVLDVPTSRVNLDDWLKKK